MISLAGGHGGNLGFQLTIFPQGGADYAHHITACPPGFENRTANLISNKKLPIYRMKTVDVC